MQNNLRKICFIAFMCFFAVPADALIVETQQLRYGTFAMIDNDAQHIIEVRPNGVINYGPAYVEISAGQRASYNVTGFPPTTALIITAMSGDLTPGGCGCSEAFNVINFLSLPASPVTDGAGAASFFLGASLRSSGSTTMHPDSLYMGNGSVTVNF